MALVSYSLDLDVTPGAIPQVVNVSEYDVGRDYTVTLKKGGDAWSIPSGTTAKVEGSIGGNAFSESATVSGNTITFTLTESMTAKAGDVWTKIKLVKDSKPIQTCAFILRCDRAGVEADAVIGASGFEEQIQDAVDDWLDEHGGITVDDTLSQQGEAADAKAVGDALDGLDERIEDLETAQVETDETLSISGAAADAKATGDAIEQASINIFVDGSTLFLEETMEGTINITENGTYSVKRYASANVNVPVGITPTGTLEINSNGTFNVANYASARVAVPTEGGGGTISDETVTYDSSYWLNSGITSSNGAIATATSAPRLLFGQNLIRYKSITVPTGFQAAIVAYSIGDFSELSYVGIWDGSAFPKSFTWHTGTIDLSALTNWSSYAFRVVFSRVSGSAEIDVSEGEAVQFMYNLNDNPWVV